MKTTPLRHGGLLLHQLDDAAHGHAAGAPGVGQLLGGGRTEGEVVAERRFVARVAVQRKGWDNVRISGAGERMSRPVGSRVVNSKGWPSS
jgi:hypothetical protein